MTTLPAYILASLIFPNLKRHISQTQALLSPQPESRQRHGCRVDTAQRCHLSLWQRVPEATRCFAACGWSFRVAQVWRSGNQSSLSARFSIALQCDLEWPLCFVCLSSPCDDNMSWLLINLFPGGRVYHLAHWGLPGRWPLARPEGFKVLF